MIEEIVKELKETTQKLYNAILQDIEDVKKAKHESLISRNTIKLELMDTLKTLKEKLNNELALEYQEGKDIAVYRESVDELELDLRQLYETNGKLAAIVLPVREMYKDIIDDITQKNGGRLVDLKA
jgi:hypothetical protein